MESRVSRPCIDAPGRARDRFLMFTLAKSLAKECAISGAARSGGGASYQNDGDKAKANPAASQSAPAASRLHRCLKRLAP
jgi:hypothetical protein